MIPIAPTGYYLANKNVIGNRRSSPLSVFYLILQKILWTSQKDEVVPFDFVLATVWWPWIASILGLERP
jgi:hypothetical protein